MEQHGKFILMDITEFKGWLAGSTIGRVISFVQNHHTYLPNYSHFNGTNYFARLEAMEQDHISRGFSEIGQNITTFPDGKLAICRSFEKSPACIVDKNHGGLCIENFGDFDKDKDKMTEAHRETIITANALLCTKFNLNVDEFHVVYHHWFADKSCPGTAFFGGNTKEAAKANFYPLIRSRMAAHADGDTELKGKVTTDELNVRSGAGVEFGVLSVLHRGDNVKVYETRGNWHRISSTGSEWISAKYVLIG